MCRNKTLTKLNKKLNIHVVGGTLSFTKFVCLFEALRPSQQFFSHFGSASWV